MRLSTILILAIEIFLPSSIHTGSGCDQVPAHSHVRFMTVPITPLVQSYVATVPAMGFSSCIMVRASLDEARTGHRGSAENKITINVHVVIIIDLLMWIFCKAHTSVSPRLSSSLSVTVFIIIVQLNVHSQV